MRQLLKRILVSGFCIALSFSTLCFAVSAEEPTTTAPLQYEIDDKMECTGYTDFSNPITFQVEDSTASFKCFIIDLNGIKRYVAVEDKWYPYFESAFTGRPMTFEGSYKGTTTDETPVVLPVTLIEGEQRTNILSYLWELNKGSMDNLNFAVYKDLYDVWYMTIGRDGTFLEFDTNPFDWDPNTDGMEALFAEADTLIATDILKKMNQAFGLPDWLYEEMTNTRAIDGKQTERFDYLTVSWIYHPDSGLEAIYRKN